MALTDKLTAIADGFRTSRGTEDKYTLEQMAVLAGEKVGSDPVIESLEITSNGTYTATDCDGYSPITVNVPQDGAPTDEELTLTGAVQYSFFNDTFKWVIEKFGNRITTKDIVNCNYMFQNSTLEEIPFQINVKNCSGLASLFANSNIRVCPKIRGTLPPSSGTFSVCESANYLRDIEDLLLPEMLDVIENLVLKSTYGGFPTIRGILPKISLRRIPSWWYKVRLNSESTAYPASSYTIYNDIVSFFVLDEILNIPVWKCNAALTSNLFPTPSYNSMGCGRIKNYTFETNEDGSPVVTEWKSQTIDLRWSGYRSTKSDVLNYNSGITADKEVKDDATYQALKDDPDWFTTKIEYSRYNHDSAVATINSLPDTSAYLATAGGTNTIKFEGASGSLTDGGAINTLTPEEILVAEQKGWIVALV